MSNDLLMERINDALAKETYKVKSRKTPFSEPYEIFTSEGMNFEVLDEREGKHGRRETKIKLCCPEDWCKIIIYEDL